MNKNADGDPDSNQGLTYGRTVAVVYCKGVKVNEAMRENGFAEIYQEFCDVSEFACANWAQDQGCSNNINNEIWNEYGDRVEPGDINNSQFENDSNNRD